MSGSRTGPHRSSQGMKGRDVPAALAALTAALGAVAYLVLALYAARGLYGRMRARSVDNGNARLACLKGDAVERFNEYDRPFVFIAAVAGGLAWPVCVPGACAAVRLVRWFDRTAPKSSAELEAEHGRMRRRIQELERELGIGRDEG